MNHPATLPPEIELRDQWPESRRYVLPRRRLTMGRWIGGVLLIVGLSVSVSFIFMILAMGLGWRQFANPCSMLLVFFIGPISWGGFAPLWWGLGCFFGHRELVIGDGYLRTVERVGLFWRSKRWKISTIGSLTVKRISDTKPPPIDLVGEFNALVFHSRAGKQGMLAWGYPIALLNGLAKELAQRLNDIAEDAHRQSGASESYDRITTHLIKEASSLANGEKPPKLAAQSKSASEDAEEEEIDEDDFDDRDERDYQPTKPADSLIEVEQLSEQELTIRIPPAGIWKGSKGLFLFSLFWCGFLVVFDGIALSSMLAANNPQANADGGWALVAFSGLFWAVGIAMLLGAINMGRRKAALAVVAGELMAIQTGIFGSKKREWRCEEVKSIESGSSGMEVNKVPILELQITGTDDIKFGLLAGRAEEEIEWLAYTLRSAVFPRAEQSDQDSEATGDADESSA